MKENSSLESWLSIAAHDLAPRAAAKVREEITAHVSSAVQQYQLEGRSELEAEALAVQDLGEAGVAARGFEKVLLTNKELDSLERSWRTSQKGAALAQALFILGVTITLLAAVMAVLGLRWANFVCLSTLAWTIPAGICCLAFRQSTLLNYVGHQVLGFVYIPVAFMVIGVLAAFADKALYWWQFALPSGMALILMYQLVPNQWRRYRKLRDSMRA